MWLSRLWPLISITFIIAGIAVGNGALIGAGFFLMVAGVTANFWSKHALDSVHYERLIPETRAFVGEELPVTLRLINDKLLPVPWIQVRDAVPEGTFVDERHVSPTGAPGYVYLQRSTHLSWYERTRWPLRFHAIGRGYYRLGPVRIASGDPFGFFTTERSDEHTNGIVIYPKVYALPDLGLPPERPFGELKGRQLIFEDPSRIAGLRDYRPGDPMRRIDWKASARHQQLQSRVYEPSSTPHLFLALNVHTMAGGSWQGYLPELLERLLVAAASVASATFAGGYAVGLMANGSYPESDRPMRIPPGRGNDQLSRVLEALAMIGPLTLTPLETVIDREAQRFPYGATLVCVTARMDAPLAASLRRVMHQGHTVSVVSLSDEAFEDDLGRITVHNIAASLRALETREGAPA